MKKKILFVTGSMGKGGAERVISNLSKYYLEKDWDVSIAMLLHDNVEYNLPENIKIVNLSSNKGIRKGFIKVLINIRKYVKETNPNIIVCFMAQNILLTGLAIKNLNIPMIVSERIDPSCVKRNCIYKFILNNIYEKSAIVVFQTKQAQAYFNKKIQSNSCIVGNPIKISTKKSYQTMHKIVSVGRLTEQKNHRMLINAFKDVYIKHPEYTLTIYGEGPLRDELESEIQKLNLKQCVFLPGISNDIHKEISDSEIFVLPSNFEGMSNALMEAMLMGFPVISTSCAGSNEIINNNENGILVPIGDKNKMTLAIEKLINDEKLKNYIAQNAEKTMIPYMEENILDKWNEVIEKKIMD